MPALYVGVDIGTSNTKVIAVTSEGDVRYATSRGYPLPHSTGGIRRAGSQNWL